MTSNENLKNELLKDLETCVLHNERYNEFENDFHKFEYLEKFSKFFAFLNLFNKFCTLDESGNITLNHDYVSINLTVMIPEKIIFKICKNKNLNKSYYYDQCLFLDAFTDIYRDNALIFKYFSFLFPKFDYVFIKTSVIFNVEDASFGKFFLRHFPLDLLEKVKNIYVKKFQNVTIFKEELFKMYYENSEINSSDIFDNKNIITLSLLFVDAEKKNYNF